MRTGEYSSTALVVALGHLYAGRHPVTRGLVDQETSDLAAEMLVRLKPGLRNLIKHMDRGWLRVMADFVSRITIPEIWAHYALRKRMLEDEVHRALGQGIERVVVLGAGFDTLAYRLSGRYPHVQFVEADFPATGRAKRKALDIPQARENLNFSALDLERDNPRPALGPATMFIAEGLLMYLSPRRVGELFAYLGREYPQGRLAFTFMECARGERIRFREQSFLIDGWLSWKGEPFTWSASEAELRELCTASGFGLPAFARPEELLREYLPRCPEQFRPASGESVCVVPLKNAATLLRS